MGLCLARKLAGQEPVDHARQIVLETRAGRRAPCVGMCFRQTRTSHNLHLPVKLFPTAFQFHSTGQTDSYHLPSTPFVSSPQLQCVTGHQTGTAAGAPERAGQGGAQGGPQTLCRPLLHSETQPRQQRKVNKDDHWSVTVYFEAVQIKTNTS